MKNLKRKTLPVFVGSAGGRRLWFSEEKVSACASRELDTVGLRVDCYSDDEGSIRSISRETRKVCEQNGSTH